MTVCELSSNTPDVFDGGSTTTDKQVYTALTATTGIIAWRDLGDTDKGKARFIDISGPTPSYGAIFTFEAGVIGANGNIAIQRKDDLEAWIIWKTGIGVAFNVNFLTVSGTTLSLNTGDTFSSGANDSGDTRGLTSLSTTSMFYAFRDISNVNPKGIVCTEAAGTVTAGAATTLDAALDSATASDLIDTDTVIVSCSSGASGYGVVCTISGTTITPGTSKNLTINSTAIIAGLSATKGIAISSSEYCVFDISGTTIGDLTTSNHSIATIRTIDKIDASQVVIAIDNATSNTGEVQTLSISGSNAVIEDSNTIQFETTDEANNAFLQLQPGETKAVIAYSRDDNTVGYDVVITLSGCAKFYNGLGVLTEKFTLPFPGAEPGAFTLDASLGTVVIGSNAPAGTTVIYSPFPYATGTASDTGLPGQPLTGLQWI